MVKQISASVGSNGTNVPQDVKIVQELLNKVPAAKGGAVPALKVDGLAWTKTTNAIKKFQHECLIHKWPDGRIDPHGKTFQALSAFDQPAPPPQDTTQKDPKTQAEADKPQSVAWAMAAQAMLAFYEVLKLKQTPDPLNDKALIETALNTHFHLDKLPALESLFLASIKYNYTRVLTALASSTVIFRSRSSAEATSDGGFDKDTGAVYPAYTFFNQSINFTAGFTKFGPLCRAAMVLHEPVHYVDALANKDNDFYEHGVQYAHLTPQQAIHNPSSYVAFAQHVFYRDDVRYGAGRANE
jgi:hypothetical protein